MDVHKLLDILELHLLPRLRVCDVQAIGQTCRPFRELVKSGLSEVMWQSVARNTYPTGHPVLGVPSNEMLPKILQFARIRAAVSSGDISVLAEAVIYEGPLPDLDACAVVNHAATQAISLQAGQFILWGLEVEGTACSSRLLWSLDCPESPENIVEDGPEEFLCRFSFSPDDRYVGAAFSIRNEMDDRSDIFANGWFQVVSVIDLSLHSIHELAQTEQFGTCAVLPAFALGSNLLVVAWELPKNGAEFQVYSPGSWERVACVKNTQLHDCAPSAWHPALDILSVASSTGVGLHAVDPLSGNVDTTELKGKGGGNDEVACNVAWSPDGQRLWYWQGTEAHVKRLAGFDSQTHELLAEFVVHPGGLTGRFASERALYDPRSLGLEASFSAIAHTWFDYGNPYNGYVFELVSVRATHFAPFHGAQLAGIRSLSRPCFSPDGAHVVAVVPPAGDDNANAALAFFDTASGVQQCSVELQGTGRWKTAYLTFCAVWASSAEHVLVHICRDKMPPNGSRREWLVGVKL